MMPTSDQIEEQVLKWEINGCFLEHAACSIEELSEMLDQDENILGFVNGVSSRPVYSNPNARWGVILTAKRILLICRGGSPVLHWEIPLKHVLKVKKSVGLFSGKITIYDPEKVTIRRISKITLDPFFDILKKAIDAHSY